MNTEKFEQKKIQPAQKPSQRISVNGNLVETFSGGDMKPAEKLSTPKSGNMNASRVETFK